MDNRAKISRKLAMLTGGVLLVLGGWLFISAQHPASLANMPPPAPAGALPGAAQPPPPASAPLSYAIPPSPVPGVVPHQISPSNTSVSVHRNDPTAGLPVLYVSETQDPTHPEMTKRVKIVRANFKYPLWRVEENIRKESAGQPESLQSRDIMIADHVMVRLQSETDRSKLESLVQAQGLAIRKVMKMPGSYLISITDDSTNALPRLLEILNKDKELIRYVEPDYVVRSQQTIPNDPKFGSLWGLNNTTTSTADISAPEIWDLTTGDPQLVIGGIDTGIDYTHPDLASNIWHNTAEITNGLDDDANGYIDDVTGWNFSDDNNSPMDGQGHGTHTAGTMGAVGNNGIGIAGVNWNCRMIPLKFLDNSGNGAISDALDALNYVAGLRRRGVNIRITNNSWGGGGYSFMFQEALSEQAALGILFMAAAGNESRNNDLIPFYPASYNVANILSVAATDAADSLASFSHYGSNTVHLAAPGVGIYSTTPAGNYGLMNGTSMATPHVAGVAALLWSLWPSANAGDIRDAILRGVDVLPSLSGKTMTGGRLNARRSVDTLFRIVHTPRGNAYNSGNGYAIDSEIGPAILTDTNKLSVFWALNEATNFTEVSCFNVSNHSFKALIPEHPEGSTLYYWLQATPITGLTVRLPSNAPHAAYSFSVVPSKTLLVTGTPATISHTLPDYGEYVLISGLVVHASAPATTLPTQGSRWACRGWLGTGSVPPSGNSNTFTFVLTNESTVNWQWQAEFALIHSSLYQPLNTTSWWVEGSTATSFPAPVSALVSNIPYRFSGWEIDGVRQPDTASTTINPVANIPMTSPHRVVALYTPEQQDSDGNGIKDWWEFLYRGNLNTPPLEDPDGDGFDNLSEFRDQTDPGDATSYPRPPLIIHAPLAERQPFPAPYTITAIITDNCQVVSAIMTWSRNGGPERTIPMTNIGNSIYTTALPAPGTNTDSFVYRLIAYDHHASSTNGPYTVYPSYPEIRLSPSGFNCLLLPGTSSNLIISVTNWGVGDWNGILSILWGGFSNDVESGTRDWTHSGSNDLWCISSVEPIAGSHSWYCGDTNTMTYLPSMHAKLDTAPFYVTKGARLSFTQWMECELDWQYWRPGWKPNNCWDGGIVEISTNSGATFQQISPIGGYTHEISGYAASPWPDGTLCFAGAGELSHPVFDLSAFAGRIAIIRFHFGGDDNTEETGWFIDNISVAPTLAPESWMTPIGTNLTGAPGRMTSLPIVTLNTTNVPTGDFDAFIQIKGNTITNPYTHLPIHLAVRSPATLTWAFAGQTSTNGTGQVTFGNLLYDADGDTCQATFEWQAENGSSWSNTWLSSLSSGTGTAILLDTNHCLISNLLTRSGTVLITNTLKAIWDTSMAGNPILFSSNTLVRARTWDGLFWSAWATSQPFMVDNEIPPTPTNLLSLVHQKNSWSKNQVMSLHWDPVQESRGSGVTHYEYGTTTNLSLWVVGGSTTGHTGLTPPIPDGTNHWGWVRASDRTGNLSTPAFFGPCWIDGTPPSAAQALITLGLSPAGNYIVGSNSVKGTWTGFNDGAGSGIIGYYFATTNAGGTTKGTWTTNTMGVLSSLKADSTNTLFVWAKDQTGWIGPAAFNSFIALSAAGDWDHDGTLNWQEEMSGSDALQGNSVFQLGVGPTLPLSPASFTLQWPGLTNRHYAIFYRDHLSAGHAWTGLPGATNLPGINGLMSFTDHTVTNRSRFYRISVTAP